MSATLERDEATEPPVAPAAPRVQSRVLGYVVLALLAYVPPLLTARGRVAADTKTYLYLDPGRLLSRAVSMWDPNVGMGTVTHQTIGYAFPMGPYYWAMDKLGLPDWVAQRLWLGSLLFFAGAGVLYLLRTFGLKGPGIVVAALAYMLTPYVLDYAARISVLLMPWAALPWMIGVIRKALREERRGLQQWRYPAIFALIVQVVGGVNATALLFAGLGPVLWILYAWLIAKEVSFRRALAVTARTGLLTLLASLWWIAGLRMQAAYGLDILRYTETIDAVARTSTPNEVLRGLGYWFFYGQDRLGPWIEAAGDYTQHLYVILAGYALVALGLLGAVMLKWKHRIFFIAVLVVGVIIAVGANPYLSPTPLGALFKAASQGSTAALAMRSTARAVPLVVLSLAIFIGLGTNVVSDRFRARGKVALAIATPVVVIALILVNFPALYNGTYYGKNLQRPEDIPTYWKQAIGALGNDQTTRVIEVPGADFASYRWGNTVDPITPGLTNRPYVARELIPYGTAGTADLLNAMDRRLQEGVADPNGLVTLLRRMGIGTVIARNDIQYERYDLVSPRELSRVLARAPGLGAPQKFGAPSDYDVPDYQDEITLAAPPNEPLLAPVVLYPVTNPTPIARAESTNNGIMMSGDGEGLVDAADVGLLTNAGIIRYSASYTTPQALRDATSPNDVLVVTDNNRLRARKWSSVKDNLGYTEQPYEADKPLTFDTADARLPLFPGQPEDAYTTTTDVGIKRVRTTAYGNTITLTPEDRGSRALDGDPFTAWRTAAFGDARGQAIQIELDRPITTDHVQLVQPTTGPRNRWITAIDITFDGKNTVHALLDPSSRTITGQRVDFPKRAFSTFKITIRATNDTRQNLFGRDDAVGFAEIGLRDQGTAQDIGLREFVEMPTDLMNAIGPGVADHPLVLVMRRDAVRPVPPRSQPELRLDRAFTLPVARTFDLTASASIDDEGPPAEIQRAYGVPDAAHGGVSSSDSQFLFGCVACRADSAIDGDPNTAWQTPFVGVRNQWIEFTSAKELSFDHMNLQVLTDGRHSVPTQIRLDVDGESRTINLPALANKPGENASTTVPLQFPRMNGHKVRVTILDVAEERSKRFATSDTSLEPVGLAELGIPGLVRPPAPAQIDSGCRSDLVTVDLKPFPVRITGPAAATERGDALLGLAVKPCDPRDPSRTPALTLGPGRHIISTARGRDVAFSIDRLVLASGTPSTPVAVAGGTVTSIGSPQAASAGTPQVTVVKQGRTSMRVHVTGATQPFWMVLGESQSKGWHARVVGAKDLGPSQLVDGYANGWRVSPTRDTFDIAMEWTPQKQVWASIWISLLTGLVCIGIVAFTWRRKRLHAAVPLAADADVTIDDGRDDEELPGRLKWIAPVLAGLLAAIAVAPWVGLLVGATIALITWAPAMRRFIVVVPAALLLICGLYIVQQQWKYHFPSVFEWDTLFPRARTLAWIAVMLLAGDAIYTVVRTRMRAHRAPSRDDPARL